ncbi:hypothetical protein [Microvirga sp. VF16]|uniref:hypothetical protein n=1 Tax=Microvirga sp. VF16 TaxID=2807101 RepID=UPI00193D8B51|nr:hypothetical protein [Microvirga sp. VF16]QRM35449.1 hypothetical protein JO965_44730 [Microvirga sp. VF16]
MSMKAIPDVGSDRTPYEIWGPPALFISFVLAGCAYIVLAKQYGLGQVLVTFVPVAFMLGYAALMALARYVRLRDDQAGDNLYYMGFLFTLTSLGASLYHFDAGGDAEYIVQNFGIAIASTITGIAARVVFNQMRRDPAEVERVARLELAGAAKRVRAELDTTVLEFNHFRRSMLQSIEESLHEVSAHVDKVGKRLLAGLEEVTEKSAAPLEAASKRSSDTIGTLTATMTAALEVSAKELSKETERLSVSAANIAGTLDGVSGKLASMQTPDEVIRIKLDPTIKGVSNAVDRLGKRLDDHAKGIDTAIESIRESTVTASEAVGVGMKASAASEVAVRDAVASCLDAIKGLSAVIDAFGSASGAQAQRAESVLARTAETLRELQQAATGAFERQASQVETLAGVVTDASERQVGHVEAIGKMVKDATEQQASQSEKLGKVVSESSDRNRAHLEDLRKLIGDATAMQTKRIDDFSRSIIDASGRQESRIESLMKVASDASERQAGHVEEMTRLLSASAKKQVGHVEEMARLVSASADRQIGHADGVSRAVTEASERHSARIEGLSSAVSLASDRLTDGMETLARLVPAIQQGANAISVAAEKLPSAIITSPAPEATMPFHGIGAANGQGIEVSR